MIKKLFIAVAILCISAPSIYAGFIQSEIGGPDWLDYGFNLRVREVGFNNIITWDDDNKADQQHFFRVRSRLWGKASPTENITAYLRFVNEYRYYAKPKNLDHPLRNAIVTDNVWANWNDIGETGLNAKVGRQDIVFKYGEGFLLMDGTPNDGSRTFYVDGVILSKAYEANTIDFLGFYNENTNSLAIDTQQGWHSDDQPIALAGLYWKNKDGIISDQTIEGYYLYKYGYERNWSTLPENKMSVIGSRLSGKVNEQVSYAGEATLELGDYGDNSMTAYGGYLHGTYTFTDVAMKPSFTLEGVYLSGNDQNKQSYQGFDPILARWPKWSELYIYSLLTEDVGGTGGHIAYWTNMEIYRAKLSLCPIEKMKVDLVYQYLRAPEANGSGGGKSRGQNPQVILKYAFTDWLSGHLWGEWFKPSSYYSGTDDGFFARWQLYAQF